MWKLLALFLLSSIASASKWIYGMYVVQQRGGAANLTANDVRFLTFESGYTYMGSNTSSATCTAPSSGADSINYCLTLPSATSAGSRIPTATRCSRIDPSRGTSDWNG